MANPLRLGIVATHPVQYYSPLYRELAARPGVDLTVYFAHRPDAAEQGTGFGVPFQWDVDLVGGFHHEWLGNVAAAPSATTFSGCDTPAVAEAIRNGAYDAVLVMGWHSKSYLQSVVASLRARVPVLVRGDSQLDPAAPALRRAAKRLLYPIMIRSFGACLSVGKRSAEYFRHYGARRIVYSPHFVDNDFFGRAAVAALPRRDQRRADWGASREDLVVLFAGKLIEKKRPLDVVRAMGRLRGRTARAVFVGDGALRGACEAEASRLGVATHFAGFRNQTQLPEDYAAADVLVLPSDARETWGLVVNEAMACGRPAVVSRAAGCSPDLIVEGETGLTFAPGDVAGLAAALESLDAPRAAAMGEQARRHVAAYSVVAAADGVLEATRLVAARR